MADLDAPAPSENQDILPHDLPAPWDQEHAQLTALRAKPGDERVFAAARRALREANDWRGLATAMHIHGANLASVATAGDAASTKAYDLLVQSGEMYLERCDDRSGAASAFAWAVMLDPVGPQATERLAALYSELGWTKPRATLVRMILATPAAALDPQLGADLLASQARLVRHMLGPIDEVKGLCDEALARVRSHREANEILGAIALDAGDWPTAIARMEAEIATLDPEQERERIGELRLRLAWIARTQQGDLATAAKHLQAAIKAVPTSIDALRDFGLMYLGSGKASDEGIAKAGDIFLKAALQAQAQNNAAFGIDLVHRALALRPQYGPAADLLEELLVSQEQWTELDELLLERRRWVGDRDADLLLRHARILEGKLARYDEARACYETLAAHDQAGSESWQALIRLYEDAGDWYALGTLLGRTADELGPDCEPEVLLKAASIFRERLDDDARAAQFYYQLLQGDPFHAVAFEGYKEHFRRRHDWAHLRDLVLYQVDQAAAIEGAASPLRNPEFAEEFVELAEICEHRLGDVDGALDAWQRLAHAYPRDERPAVQIARITKRVKMWDNMLRLHESELARTSDPAKRIDVLRRLVQVYRDRTTDPERAIELYLEILTIDPDDHAAARALTAMYDRVGNHAEVVRMLGEQYERAEGGAEQVALLRRMSEIWHDELGSVDQAIWACERILEIEPGDRESLHRLQTLRREQGAITELLTALDAEFNHTPDDVERAGILRRMAHIAEGELGDQEYAAGLWSALLDMTPDNLDVVDRVIDNLTRANRNDELANLLERVASSSHTPELRRFDYWSRLGRLAQEGLDDPDLARKAFEAALKLRPDHRPTLQVLADLYRSLPEPAGLASVLGALLKTLRVDEDRIAVGWEGANVLANELNRNGDAADMLHVLLEGPSRGNRELLRQAYNWYKQDSRPAQVIADAQLILSFATDPQERRGLHDSIVSGFLALDDKPGALAAFARYLGEFGEEAETLRGLAKLQAEIGETVAATSTLRRLYALARTHADRIDVHIALADIGMKVGDADGIEQAVAELRVAVELNPSDAGVLAAIDRLGSAGPGGQGSWARVIELHGERFEHFAGRRDLDAQLDVAKTAAFLAEARLNDPRMAFQWLARVHFQFMLAGLDSQECEDSLAKLAERHNLWSEMLALLDGELEAAPDLDADIRAHKLAQAGSVAHLRLQDPPRAATYLARALGLRPADTGIQEELRALAEQHQLWTAMVAVHEAQLAASTVDIGRFEAFAAIASVHEEKLASPRDAFETWRRAWRLLRRGKSTLAEEALDALRRLADKHNLWHVLAEHYLELSDEWIREGEREAGLEALVEAAELVADRQSDLPGALRLLARAAEYDIIVERGPLGDAHPDGPKIGERVLPVVRHFAERLDKDRPAGKLGVGAFWLLRALARLIAQLTDNATRIPLLKERAQIRMNVGNKRGAAVEWLRVLRLDAADQEARDAVHELAQDPELVDVELILLGSDIDRARDSEAQRAGFELLAKTYLERCNEPELALRAKMQGLLRHALAIPPGPELGEHAELWKLTAEVEALGQPSPARLATMERLRAPRLELPEPQDVADAIALGVDLSPTSSAEKAPPPPPVATKPTTASEVVEDFDDVELTDVEDVEDVEDLEMVDGDEFDDVEELEEIDDVEETQAPVAAKPASRPGPPSTPSSVPPPRPAEDPSSGLPRPLEPSDAPLPPRPDVKNRWEELCNTYAQSMPTPNREARTALSRWIARVQEEGAKDVDAAMSALERAVLSKPDTEGLLQDMFALADRHQADERLIQALERCIGELTLPEHVLPLTLAAVDRFEQMGDPARAEARCRAFLKEVPREPQVLRRLISLLAGTQRHADYAAALKDLIDVSSPLTDVDLIRGLRLELAKSQAALGERTLAIDGLRAVLRGAPKERVAHDLLVDMLILEGHWTPAIDALRTASEALADPEAHANSLRRIAEIYTRHLKLPRRAIEAWNEVREFYPDAEDALENLQALYTAEGDTSAAIDIIDARLARATEHHDARRALLQAKAHVLQQGGMELGDAERTLLSLIAEQPDDDSLLISLVEIRRRRGDVTGARQALIERRERLEAASNAAADADRASLEARIATVLLTRIEFELDHENLDEVEELVARTRMAVERGADQVDRLRSVELTIARRMGATARLIELLAESREPQDLLESARLASERGDEIHATRVFSRLLAEHGAGATAERNLDIWAGALEGITRLRAADGNEQAALDRAAKEIEPLPAGAVKARGYAELGRLVLALGGDSATARGYFDSALKQSPDDPHAKLGLAKVLLEIGDNTGVETVLTAALEAFKPDSDERAMVEALSTLAAAQGRLGKHGDSYRRLTAALRHVPDHVELRASLVMNRVDAKRPKDALVACDQLHNSLSARLEKLEQDAAADDGGGRGNAAARASAIGLYRLDAVSARAASQAFQLASDAEKSLGSQENARARLERAVEIDPTNVRALEAAQAMANERGDQIAAARFAAVRARLYDDQKQQAGALLEAAISLLDSVAEEVGGSAAREHKESKDDERSRAEQDAFLWVAQSMQISRTPGSLPRQALEEAYRRALVRAPKLAGEVVDRLLSRPDIEPEARVDFLMVAGALERNRALESGEPPLGAVVRLRAAHELLPDDLSTTVLLAELIAECEGEEPAAKFLWPEIERLDGGAGSGLTSRAMADSGPQAAASSITDGDSTASGGAGESLTTMTRTMLDQGVSESAVMRLAREREEHERRKNARVQAWLNLAQWSRGNAAHEMKSLERAAEHDPKSLGIHERRRLAALYDDQQDPDIDAVIENHRALVQLDPFAEASLAALAAQAVADEQPLRALQYYRVLHLVATPGNAAAREAEAFLSSHTDHVPRAAGTSQAPLDMPTLIGERTSDSAGVSTALRLLLEGAPAVLADLLPRRDIDSARVVSPLQDGELALAWSDVLKLTGPMKLMLVDERDLPAKPDEATDAVIVLPQVPPVLVATATAAALPPAELRYALARALFAAQGAAYFALAAPRESFARLMSALLIACHPRHARRKQSDSDVTKLASDLLRKLPTRVSREITQAFREGEAGRFDSHSWRAHANALADRCGLVLCGDLSAALRAKGASTATLRTDLERSPELRALLSYFASKSYATARGRLGAELVSGKSDLERADAGSASAASEAAAAEQAAPASDAVADDADATVARGSDESKEPSASVGTDDDLDDVDLSTDDDLGAEQAPEKDVAGHHPEDAPSDSATSNDEVELAAADAPLAGDDALADDDVDLEIDGDLASDEST